MGCRGTACPIMASIAWAPLALFLHWLWWLQGCISHCLLFSLRYSCTAAFPLYLLFKSAPSIAHGPAVAAVGPWSNRTALGSTHSKAAPPLARSHHVNAINLSSVPFHCLFSPFSRNVRFHAWVCYFCYALGSASSCLLIIFFCFVLCWFFFFTVSWHFPEVISSWCFIFSHSDFLT